MSQPDSELLEQLRDVRFPAETSLWSWSWPPAPIWWLLAVLFVLVIWLSWRRFHGRRQQRTPRQEQLQNIYQRWQQHGDPQQYLQQVNRELRHQALEQDGRLTTARLQGESWKGWLEKASGAELTSPTLEALTVSCYQRTPAVNIEEVHRNLTRWLQQNHEYAADKIGERSHV
ncbi:MAG: DUF4381 domain-containing protein [Gammaproteobacteria bacterium]|nr:DUF4381 domain-containing protein [Gammaproteobacteria bacterium]